MSMPTEADFAIIKVGDGASPSQAFDAICGVENVAANKTANANDRYRRDCTKLGKPAIRKNRVTGLSLTITASGAMNIDNFGRFEELLGVANDYQIEFRNVDGTDSGVLLGTYSGSYVMVSDNVTVDPNADSSGEINLNNEGPWLWTPAS
jgi:hypothetical protein